VHHRRQSQDARRPGRNGLVHFPISLDGLSGAKTWAA
jgi:hypothetical protein